MIDDFDIQIHPEEFSWTYELMEEFFNEKD